MSAKLRAIYIADREGAPMQSVSQVEVRSNHGIVGDKGAGIPGREVTVFRREDYEDALASAGLHGVADGSTRRNLETEGLTAEQLRGPVLRIGSVVLRVTDECHPCKLMERYVGPGAMEALQGRAGVTCVVEQGGTIGLGASVQSLATTG